MVLTKTMAATAAACTAVWLAVTILTRPEPREKLLAFYRRIRPAQLGWRPVAEQAPEVQSRESITANFTSWVLASAMVYLALFATGKLLLGEPGLGLLLLGGAIVSGALLYWQFSRSGWESFG